MEGNLIVTVYQWSSWFFHGIPDILSYLNFRVKPENPGVIFLRKYSDSTETTFKTLTPTSDEIDPYELPEETVTKGLDLARQWYSYEKICPHCKSTLAADFTCPKPSQAKPTTDTPELQVVCDTSSEKARCKRTCSTCHILGHTKRTCSQKYLSPFIWGVNMVFIAFCSCWVT